MPSVSLAEAATLPMQEKTGVQGLRTRGLEEKAPRVLPDAMLNILAAVPGRWLRLGLNRSSL